jgi:hypothetical protein
VVPRHPRWAIYQPPDRSGLSPVAGLSFEGAPGRPRFFCRLRSCYRLKSLPSSANAKFGRMVWINRQSENMKPHELDVRDDRRWRVRYAVLTAILFVPLILAFVSIRDLYPFAASKMMLWNSELQSGRDYYLLRGETVSGETIDLPPIKLTNALTGRSWSLVKAGVENQSFKIRWPHPANLRLAAAFGGPDKLPRAARLEDLLRAWGQIYNSRLSGSSNLRLKSIRLDGYRWEGGLDGDYDRFVESWRAVL